VYGKEARMRINLEINDLTYVVNIEDPEEVSPLHIRYNQLIKVEEQQVKALNKIKQRQQIVKRYFDQGTTMKFFQKGELVLLWNKAKEKPSMHTKFESVCIGPYIIENILGFDSYMLKDIKGTIQMLLVNGQHLKSLFVSLIFLLSCT
jgi:hypothetical protein